MINNNATTIDKYFSTFSIDTQKILAELRQLVNSIAPEVEECISYGMPAFKINKKPLIYFAAYKNHIGFYALPSSHKKLQTHLAKYKQGKGSVQFPIDEPMPIHLISIIIKYRLKELATKLTTSLK
jgi:uncharacterized protein YdhG (YjbR/CyaY superfamily)